MTPTKLQLSRLKSEGFKWFKESCTDRVEPEVIQDIIPAANGFTVVYNENAVLEYSTATVHAIDWPEDSDHWIMVHWENITDQRRNYDN